METTIMYSQIQNMEREMVIVIYLYIEGFYRDQMSYFQYYGAIKGGHTNPYLHARLAR